jgi:hypothetical protein
MTKRAKRAAITQEQFDEALIELIAEMSADCIVAIPGVYEAISEALNNDAIDRARENAGQS